MSNANRWRSDKLLEMERETLLRNRMGREEHAPYHFWSSSNENGDPDRSSSCCRCRFSWPAQAHWLFSGTSPMRGLLGQGIVISDLIRMGCFSSKRAVSEFIPPSKLKFGPLAWTSSPTTQWVNCGPMLISDYAYWATWTHELGPIKFRTLTGVEDLSVQPSTHSSACIWSKTERTSPVSIQIRLTRINPRAPSNITAFEPAPWSLSFSFNSLTSLFPLSLVLGTERFRGCNALAITVGRTFKVNSPSQ